MGKDGKRLSRRCQEINKDAFQSIENKYSEEACLNYYHKKQS